VVRVPSVEEEDRRQLHRELTTAKQDRTRVINRIKGLLAGLFAIIWAEPKSFHNRLISVFSGCVHFATQRPAVESA
jgi:hypothetical protein